MDAHERASIQILPDDLASQIAAGEVVERPSSVAKELIENALDAGALRIEVAIESGGIGLIQIKDDGSGIHPLDAPFCLVRHATSKLRRIEDLETLDSFGFRGEALSSIASVSRLVIETRHRDQQSGFVLEASGTIEAKTRPVGHPVGTTISVRDLFFNVPARRKFLKSSNTESGHVVDVVTDAALSRPDVSFTLVRDGRRVRQMERVIDQAKRVAQVLGDEQLMCISGQRGPLSLVAYLAPPQRSTRGASGLKVFVNSRPVKDRAIAATVAHAFGQVLERGRYPKGVVFLTLPTRLLDVNVHPQKTEVRFADPRAVSDAVYGIVARGLATPRSRETLGTPTLTTMERSAPGKVSFPLSPSEEASAPRQSGAHPLGHGSLSRRAGGVQLSVQTRGAPPVSGQRYEVVAGASTKQQWSEVAAKRDPDSSQGVEETATLGDELRGAKSFRFLGQAKDSYLICATADGVYTLDQHAADELGIFHRLTQAYQTGGLSSQSLLFPVALTRNKRDTELLEKKATLLLRLGLDVRVPRDGALHLHAVPGIIKRATPEELILVFLNAARATKSEQELLTAFFAAAACREAVPLGKSLSVAEAQGILKALPSPLLERTPCAHGLPVLHHVTYSELGRRKDHNERRGAGH